MNAKKHQRDDNAVVEQSASPVLNKTTLSTQQQAAHDNATTHTKNDGSHIAQQRAARLSQHKSKATKTQETN